MDLGRRRFLGWMAGGLAAAATGRAVAAPRRPNIIFVLTDDQRWDAMGCAGHPWLQTPNMDRLAREGALFENAFVTTSLCSPSRASFLTGCYAHVHEVWGNVGRDPRPGLPTFPQLLQKAGYETAYIGKWHMASSDKPRPGFDHWVSFSGQGKYFGCSLNVNGQRSKAAKYITDELTDHAVSFLAEKRERPFLLILSHKAVHAPFTPAKRHANLYKDEDIRLRTDPADRLSDKVPWGRKRPENWRECIRGYMAGLVAVDEGLGRVLTALEKQGTLDDTAVIFAGDNGYFHGEHGGLWDKRAAYEPAMRIPLLMRYPRMVKPGSRCRALTLNIDLAPTALELAGVDVPQTAQGESWVATVTGRSEGRNSFLYEYFREADRRFNRPSTFAVRTRRWKYIEYPELGNRVVELYDLEKDPGELDNLAASKPDVLRQMRDEMARLKKETGFRPRPGKGQG